MSGWALDLGTSNSGIARWDPIEDRPQMVTLPGICRQPSSDDHLEAPRLVPSAVHLLEPSSMLERLGRSRLLAGRAFVGDWALVGQPALERNVGRPHAAYARTFKQALGVSPLRTLARSGGRDVSARQVARTFLRQLLKEVKDVTGERVRDIVVTSPVDSYESYRAEVSRALQSVGVRRVRFLDEPVAAALGYGLSVRADSHILVVDFGAGTLDLALVHMKANQMPNGVCEVVAKEGRNIGGNSVDRWILDEMIAELGYDLGGTGTDSERFWYQMMLDEARRVKEGVFFNEEMLFAMTPPEELRAFEARIRGEADAVSFKKERLQQLLVERELFDVLDSCTSGIARQMREAGLRDDDIDDVLMVGGSTLLPGVYGHFEQQYGRDRVRAWQPFEAVTYGATAYAADRFTNNDFIVHEYAILTYDLKTHEPQYVPVIPKGTRVPTSPDFWRKQLVPACSFGEPETMFSLVICELGEAAHEQDRRFAWDAGGELHKVGGKQPAGDGGRSVHNERLIVPLNEHSPTLGQLKPPHQPSDRRPRLDVQLGVDSNRWLIATVRDLRTDKLLLDQTPVVRIL